MKLPFSKLNGLGNSFILMNDLDGQVSAAVDVNRLAKQICDPGFGIGADGLILVQSARQHDYRMTIINSDGSEAEMCGNGIRCMTRFLAEEQITCQREMTIETLAGPIDVIQRENNLVEVDMGRPIFRNGDVVTDGVDELVSLDVSGFPFTYISMGNPHAVTFVDSFGFNWKEVGARVAQETGVFPNRTNVEFGKVENASEMTMKVWERGCGATLACGTGTCALVVAAVHTGRVAEGDVLVHLPGGDLSIHYLREQSVRMTGPAVTVCRGVYEYV